LKPLQSLAAVSVSRGFALLGTRARLRILPLPNMLLRLLLLPLALSCALPNVLHLIADDLRPQLGAYGSSFMLTPALDALAAGSLTFDRAYTQFAYCAPSRNSFLTGRRPERTRCLNFLTDFRQTHGAAWTALPQFFKDAGYFTSAAGKVYHDGMDDPLSWTFASNQTAWIPCLPGDAADEYKNFCGVTNASVHQYTDEDLALEAGLARMRAGASSGQPWWVSIGVHRPHWPERLPQGWHGNDVYPSGVQPPAWPLGIAAAPYMSGAYRDGDAKNPALGCPVCAAPTNDTIEYRRWYYAAVSYTDHMLGKALALLDELGPAVVANTIVVFHSDHGYQLGELNEWSKKTNTDLATRVPLIIRVPWKTESVGARTAVRAELVDLYRTLVDLAGLDAAAIQGDVQGVSLAPLFDAPAAPPPALVAKPAFSQIGSCACKQYVKGNWSGLECNAGRCVNTNVTDFDFMGYSVSIAQGGSDWRYTLWAPMNSTTQRVDFNGTLFDELYNQTADGVGAGAVDFDFDGYALNVASSFPAVVAALRPLLIDAVLSWY